jgi:hypothetical protein
LRKSIAISSALHVSVLLFAIAEIQSPREVESKPMIDVPVELVTPDEFTKIKAGLKTAEDEKPAAQKPKEQSSGKDEKNKEVVKQAAVAPAAASEPEPAPKQPEPKKAPEPKEKAEPLPDKKKEKNAEPKKSEDPQDKPKKAESKPKPEKKPEPKKPVEQKQKDFDADRIAAQQPRIDESWETVTEDRPALGQSSGADLTMSANELDFLRQRISQCWSPPVGGIGADAIRVRLRLQLNQDGSLTTNPEVMNSGSSPFFQPAADSAVRAVAQCQPYELPAEKYALWKDIILNFDPREMFGG